MKSDKFWKDKKVLIIGHTGFHGSWLTVWLRELGAHIIGYGLEPKNSEDNYVLCKLSEKIDDIQGDIRDRDELEKVFDKYEPEIVINLASSSSNNNEPLDIYESNIMGTVNILECIRKSPSVKVGIMVTSDKCYSDKEQIWGYREDDRLGGDTPSSASYACAEMVISSYRNTYLNPYEIDKHGKSIASVRTGRVIGGGDWNEDRIIPACAKAFINKDSVVIKDGDIIQPWQHVLEPTRGILILAQKMYENPGNYCESWNFGPEYSSCMSTIEAVTKFQKEFRKGEILELDEDNSSLSRETMVLDITKAKYKLGWKPKWTIDKTISYTADWYKNYKNKDVYGICRNHIEKYSLL